MFNVENLKLRTSRLMSWRESAGQRKVENLSYNPVRRIFINRILICSSHLDMHFVNFVKTYCTPLL